MKAKIIDISNWEVLPQYSTEGTRDKRIVQSPDGFTYYFKTSFKKTSSDGQIREYRHEFWSEVIACRIASLLGFNALLYDVAYRKEDDETLVGCISQSMISEGQSLISGFNLIVGYLPNFGVDSNFKRDHRLPLICRTLEYYRLSQYRCKIIECLVLDAIIGNTDRHSENWAMISPVRNEDVKEIFDKTSLQTDANRADLIDNFKELQENGKKLALPDKRAEEVEQEGNMPNWKAKEWLGQCMYLAPIYDSGSSLGREYTEDELQAMLDDGGLNRYIEKGTPDIQIKESGRKRTFLECIEDLCQDYKDDMGRIYEQNLTQRGSEQIAEMVDVVDQDARGIIPEELCLSSVRKDFISRLINIRIERIKKIIQKHVSVS